MEGRRGRVGSGKVKRVQKEKNVEFAVARKPNKK
jgi:hypothetical protein